MENIPINTDSPSVIQEIIYQLKIKDVMSKDLITLRKSGTMRNVQVTMAKYKLSAIPITNSMRILGLVSIEDIIKALDYGYINDKIEKHMTRKLIVLEDDMPLSFAISYFNKYNFGRFPVLNKEKELVGIISMRDINAKLLEHLNSAMQALENSILNENPSTIQSNEKIFQTTKFNFEIAGKASTEIKKSLKKLNLDRKFIRRVAVASYELEINQVVHSDGGTIKAIFDKDKITIIAKDRGPGIPDLKKALTEGFSTANDWIRSLGFGAGMGLPNSKRVADGFDIESSESGTTVKVDFNIPKELI
ncbi:CBS domain-containing protein [Thiospirochaeta perfilievii]|uniref:CBS domain-containing protein n=1 Tax=Thiospirochaeta perfilievii TaxID=252967 RepID=A0A5C1QBY5_9SPIO|nr:CBS domain-containing protein [Thiospirochaeta perfilievii]QEN04174.1 CBS domain-containing protein [Thiospirochaeta perfilievii]